MKALRALAALSCFALAGAAAAEPVEVRTPPDGAGEGSCLNSACHAALGAGGVVHAPVAGGACDSCHEYSGAGHGFKPTPSPAASVCLSCHEDPRAAGKFAHAPAADGECTVCHDPHSSANPALLVEPENDLCAICHDVLAEPDSRPFVHGAVRELGCAGCHDPHAAPAARLLRAERTALCLGCHGASASPKEDAARDVVLFGRIKVEAEFLARLPKIALRDGRGHPVAKHPAAGAPDPRTAGAAISCDTCHEAHNSTNSRLLRGAGGRSACRQCHAK